MPPDTVECALRFSDAFKVIATSIILQYPSLVQGLANHLAECLTASGNWEQSRPLPPFKVVAMGTVATPLPLQLASQNPQTPLQDWAALLMEALPQSLSYPPKGWLHPQGWLYLTWHDQTLADWLCSLLTTRPYVKAAPFHHSDAHALRPRQDEISTDPILFQLQYVHARCWSLLRLAQQLGVLPGLLDKVPPGWQDVHLWLTEAGEWRSQTPSEQALMGSLLNFPHSLSPQSCATVPSPPAAWIATEIPLSWPIPVPHLHRQAALWGRQFLDFYDDCRLFGHIQHTEPEVQQMRLALVFIVQWVVAFLLEEGLSLNAPLEL